MRPVVSNISGPRSTRRSFWQPEFTYGYVEPYPEVYERIEELMKDLRAALDRLGVAPQGVPEKIRSFEDLLARLSVISERELSNRPLTDDEYRLIWNLGSNLASMKNFPSQIMEKIGSGGDEKMSLAADVHTDLNTRKALEEAVGWPFNIYVIVEDHKGKRLCRGGLFSYYEFKQPMLERLTDEQWQHMLEKGEEPRLPQWTITFTAKQ